MGVMADHGNRNEVPTEVERARRRRLRSLAIAAALGGLVVLFYIATIVRLGGHVFNRPL